MTKNYENEIEKTGLLLDAVQKKQVCADTDKMKFDLLQMLLYLVYPLSY